MTCTLNTQLHTRTHTHKLPYTYAYDRTESQRPARGDKITIVPTRNSCLSVEQGMDYGNMTVLAISPNNLNI